MINYLTLGIYLTLNIFSYSFAQQETPRSIDPDTLNWFSPSHSPQFSCAWIAGNETEKNIYIFRAKLSANGLLPPLKHPDIRYGTVLSGTLYLGFGRTIDDSTMVAIQSGEVYCIPANVTHYLKAGNSGVTYQEIGVGPTETTGRSVIK
jgi:hypothetical protein